MKDEATRLAALRSGKVDYIGHNAGSSIKTPDAMESLQRTNPDLKVWPYYFRSNAGMAYNVSKPPFNDIRVRKALQLALDLETINKSYRLSENESGGVRPREPGCPCRFFSGRGGGLPTPDSTKLFI